MPASLTASDTSEIKMPRPSSKHRWRSVSIPTAALIPVRQSSSAVDLAPILVPHSGENSSRRVSFADSPSTLVVRRNTLPEPRRSLATSIPAIPHCPSPCLSRPGTPPSGCLDDLNAHDSDSSLSKPSRLQKLKLGFNRKTIRQLPADKQSDRDSITSLGSLYLTTLYKAKQSTLFLLESTASENVTKRCGNGFVAAWSNSRTRTAGEQAFASPSRSSFVRLLSPSTPTTFTPSSSGFANIQSPTFLSNKAERRRSTPIPRTYPYGAPYFASPPVLLGKNTYPSYLKALPQFESEVQLSSGYASERDREPVMGKISLARNPSCKVIPKRRSASEDWTVRPLQ